MAFVLIVEGSKALADRASDVLIESGHGCGWVPAAEPAVALLRWRAPGLVLLDQALPGADGGALPRTLRRAANSPDLPIILLTTRTAADPLDSSVTDQISKPFDPRYLVWRVNHALEAHAGPPLFFDDSEDHAGEPPAAVPGPIRSLA